MSFFGLLFLFVGIIVAFIVFKTISDEKSKHKEELLRIAHKANEYLQKVNSLKTTKSKINNCDKALEALYAAEGYNECRNVIENYDQLIEKIHSVKKVLPVGDYLEKANKHHFKQNKSAEKNSLLDALYEIETNNITNNDFDIAELHDDQTGEITTKETITNRLEELGWTKED